MSAVSLAAKHFQRAQREFNECRWKEALGELQIAIGHAPGNPRILILKSYVFSYLGRYREARESALTAAQSAPDSTETLADVIARLRTFNECVAMNRYIAALGSVSRLPIPVLLQCAVQLSYLNLQSQSLAMLEEAERADPDYPPTLLSLAQVLVYMGRAEDALRRLRRAQQLAPEISDTYWLLAQLGRFAQAGANDIDAIRRRMSSASVSAKDRIHFGMALHRLLDEAGDYEAAFDALNEAMKTKRGSLKYSASDSRHLFGRLVDWKDSPPQPDRESGIANPSPHTPIFIIGMHRSGTTLLEQMLDGHSQVHGAGELYDFTSAMRYATDHHCQGVIDATIVERASQPGFDFAPVGRRYLEGVQWRLGGKRFFTDKLPSNFLNAGFICRALPQAKLLHMVRDPREVCFSNLRELFSSANPYSYDQIELADFHLQYHALMAHWREKFPGRIFDIHYDRLVREPEVVIREVCEFCGLDFEPEMLAIGNRTRGVSTASAVQVRSGIQARDVPKWKPYEAQLQPMIERLRVGGVLPD